MGRETLGEEPERENGPEGVEPDPVHQGGAGGPAHAEDAGADALVHRKRDAAEDDQEEEVHQEEEQGPLDRGIRLGYEVIEKDRIIEEADPVRKEEDDLDMPQDDQHEPAEGDARMHIAQQPVPFPQFDVEKAVAEDVPDILQGGFRSDERQEEPLPVLAGKLQEDPDDADETVSQHEDHPRDKGDDKRMEA